LLQVQVGHPQQDAVCAREKKKKKYSNDDEEEDDNNDNNWFSPVSVNVHNLHTVGPEEA
jgi:hypothetical protein